MRKMSETQFAALAQILRLRAGPAKEAARLHFVVGLKVSEAARKAGIDYRLAAYSVKRVRAGLALAIAATQ